MSGASSRAAGGRLVQLPEFALAIARNIQEMLHVFNRLLFRIGLNDRKPSDDLLRFREWPVGDAKLAL